MAAGPVHAAGYGSRLGDTQRPSPTPPPPPPFRITSVELRPGGFQPCPGPIPLGLGARLDPDARYFQCVLASVTLQASPSANSVPLVSEGVEAWGFAVANGRYDYRSDPQLYQERLHLSADHQPGQTVWRWDDVVVAYYDGRLTARAQQSGAAPFSPNEPAVVRDQLESQGATMELQVDGTDAPAVHCHFWQGHGPLPDRLSCTGLPQHPSGVEDRLRPGETLR